jgi:nucleoside-diphosphate-sugar epimerase
MLIETTGADVEPEYDEPRPYEITHSVSDISRASGAFGYAPRYSLDESIPSVVEWMRMNLEKRSAPRPYQK